MIQRRTRPSIYCLLITLTCSLKAKLRRAQLNGIGRMHVKGAVAAAKRPWMIPEHSSQARCFWKFENAAKSGAFSKRYGFICRVNGETASILVRLQLRHEICILRFKMVNLARSLALACVITSHHICFSSLKRSKISLYLLWTYSQ